MKQVTLIPSRGFSGEHGFAGDVSEADAEMFHRVRLFPSKARTQSLVLCHERAPSMRLRTWLTCLLFVVAFITLPVTSPAQGSQPAPDSTGSTPAPGAPRQAPATPPSSPGAAASAGPNASNTIHAIARLVVLDAVVVDKRGNAVAGLTRNDFHVQEDGADQTIRNFDAPGTYTPKSDEMIDSTADLDRVAPRAPVNIILLDEFNTLFEDMAFARYSLKKWLNTQPDKLNTPTMLVSVSLEKFQVLHDYTQNKDEILSALDHHFAAYPWQAHNYSWISERYATAFFTLRRVAEATEGHPGHKNMIWIGRGLPNISLLHFSSIDRDHVHGAMQPTINELRDARVTLYTIDPAGVMVDPSRYGEDAALFDPFGGEPNFQELARATGGRNLYGRNDVDAEIGTSIRDGASFYTLTYRPTDPTRDVNHFRKISVTIPSRPELKVVTRQGYFDSRAPARLTADGQVNRRLGTELAGAATSTMVYDAVPITLATRLDTPGTYVLHVAGQGLYWTPATDTDPRMSKLILTVSTFDKKGKVLKVEGKALTVKAPATVQPTGRLDRSIAIEYQVPPDPKAVRARFVIRVDATGRMGTADADLLNPPQAASTGTPAAATPQ